MDYELLALYKIMKAFGWSNERIVDVKVKNLATELRAMVTAHLTPAGTDMLNRWREGGIFDLRDRRKKQPRYRAEVRRNGARRSTGALAGADKHADDLLPRGARQRAPN